MSAKLQSLLDELDALPQQDGKILAVDVENLCAKYRTRRAVPGVPIGFEACGEAWERWLANRRQRGCPVTMVGAKQTWQRAIRQGWTPQAFNRRVEEAIERGWRGLIFPDEKPMVVTPPKQTDALDGLRP